MLATFRPALILALLVSVPAVTFGQGFTPVTPAAETRLVRQAAFTLWWPEYDRLMRQFITTTPEDAGRIALPEPSPEGFFSEIEILGRRVHPALKDATLYSVTTEGDLFQALFVLNERDRAWPLINRVDPSAFRPEMNATYVEAVNALFDREDVRPLNAEQALDLSRFVIELFYNFDYRYGASSVDSITFAELNLVRVLQSTDEIPQGLRRFDSEKGNALLYGKIPERVQGIVTPPRVQTLDEDDYLVSFYTWHPVYGELKWWEIRLTGGYFASLEDRTVEKWVSFTVETF